VIAKQIATLHNLPLDFEIVLDFVEQDTDPIPLHVPALGVEIEVLILYFWHLELAQEVRFSDDGGRFWYGIPTWEKDFS